MRVTRSIAAFCIAVLLIAGPLDRPQPLQDGERPRIAFADYVAEVVRANLDLATQRINIDISRAGATTAATRPDWVLDIGVPGAALPIAGFQRQQVLESRFLLNLEESAAHGCGLRPQMFPRQRPITRTRCGNFGLRLRMHSSMHSAPAKCFNPRARARHNWTES